MHDLSETLGEREHPWRTYVHLPCIRLAEEGPMEFPEGAFEHLPLRRWEELDGDFTGQDTDYADSAPVFWVASYPESTKMRAARKQAEKDAARLHLACLITSCLALPEPKLSCLYLSEEDGYCPCMVIGNCGREWILGAAYKPFRWKITRGLAQDVLNVYRLIGRTEELARASGISGAIFSLLLATDPSSCVHFHQRIYWNEFIICVGALEELLIGSRELPPSSRPTGGVLSQRLAALVSNGPEELETYALQFRPLYPARTDFIHGRRKLDSDMISENLAISAARWALCDSILRAMEYLDRTGEPFDLPSLLAKCWELKQPLLDMPFGGARG